MSAKFRGPRSGYRKQIRPLLVQGKIDRRTAFSRWNRTLESTRLQDYNESYWRFRIGRRKLPPQPVDFGITQDVARTSRRTVDDIIDTSA